MTLKQKGLEYAKRPEGIFLCTVMLPHAAKSFKYTLDSISEFRYEHIKYPLNQRLDCFF